MSPTLNQQCQDYHTGSCRPFLPEDPIPEEEDSRSVILHMPSLVRGIDDTSNGHVRTSNAGHTF